MYRCQVKQTEAATKHPNNNVFMSSKKQTEAATKNPNNDSTDVK